MNRSLTLLFVLATQMGWSQTVLTITGEDGNPIEGVVVEASSLETSTSFTGISDSNGKLTFALDRPIVVRFSHLAFHDRQDTVYHDGSYAITMTPDLRHLDQVVVTGQYLPQSAKNSVYAVRSITAERIESMGAVSVQQVLANELFFRFDRDNAVGGSRVNLQGLSGQNIKVLLDGVPIVGRSGTANEVDLNQINIQSIERIEIVEGPQAVNYGADAIAGVINIITKKDIAEHVQVDITLHEETVGSEYDWFEEGIHNPSMRIGVKPHVDWFAQYEGRLQHFGGWTGASDGREKEWYPKDQWFNAGLVRYEKDRFELYYRLDALTETITNLGKENSLNPLLDPYAIDEKYRSMRLSHQLQGNFILRNASTLNWVVSRTDYRRSTDQYYKNLVTEAEHPTIADEQDSSQYTSLFCRGSWNNALGWKSNAASGSSLLGIDAQHDVAVGTTLSNSTKVISELAPYASSELVLNDNLNLRLGVRFTMNSVFRSVPTPSVNLKYAINSDFTLRLGYGRGYRAPSVRELYHEFIDASHHIIGNPELKPEFSHNANVDFSYGQGSNFQLSIAGFFNYLENQITYYTPTSANAITSYINLYRYKTIGAKITSVYDYKHLKLTGGFAMIGYYQLLSEGEQNDLQPFLFTPEITLNTGYNFKGTQLSLYYKYIGSRQAYQLQTDKNGIEQPVLTSIEGYHSADFTISRSWINWLSTTCGIRNLFDTTNLSATQSMGVHGTDGQQSVAYGRSFFLQINFHLTK